MSKYVKLKNDFQNFVRSVEPTQFSHNETKFINLILNNFDDISDVGTSGGNKRAKLIKDILNSEWEMISSELMISSTSENDISFPIKQLKKIDIENFRGFLTPFSYNFNKPYTLIYGTNGSGKTSFCEALEYSLLGYITEAESKRYDTTKYIVNFVSGKGQKPKLTAINNESKEIEVTPNPNLYHFCFIEKNRIDGFARISANTPSNQNQLLSTLLGLEDFNNFVSGFTENIENYINIKIEDGVYFKELNVKKQEIEVDQLSIEKNQSNLDDLEIQKELIVKESKLEKSFEDIDIYINGIEGAKGRLSEIEDELQNIAKTRYDSTSLEQILSNCSTLKANLDRYNELKSTYDNSKDQINFKQLFTAVKELRGISGDKCPACHTPLEEVVKNPYDLATEMLSELGKLTQLEKDIELVSEEIISKTINLIKDIGVKVKFATELSSSVHFNFTDNLLTQELKQRNINDKIIDINKLIKEVENNKLSLSILEELLTFKNKEYEESSRKKAVLQEEKSFLLELSDKIKSIKTQEAVYKKSIREAQSKLEEFEKANQSLMQKVELEKKQIEKNNVYVTAYKSILNKLKKYNRELPGKLISNMNELTKNFYNEINKHDTDFEILEKIELPTKPEERIIAYFKDDPNKPVDALHVLSEGHIRCLGLALLLSKIVRDDINIIIFDDVVNAIDDDHRGGIRELLFNHSELNSKQIILTSHAEEFIKDLENQAGKKLRDKLVDRITFLPPENRLIKMDNITTSHYLTNAKQFLERSQKRESLRYCRSALENINSALWKRLGRTYNALITVKMRQPKGIPETMSAAQGLSKFIKELKKKGGHDKFDRIIEIYDFLTGLETTYNTAWNYLNKGTHEEEGLDEFDALIVKRIYENLEDLDNEAKTV